MHRLPLLSVLLVLGLLACEARAPDPDRAPPGLIDVSGDDCTASTLVFDRPPSRAADADPGTAFVNDGCYGDRIFLGIQGTRRELKRAEDLPLGSGGAYSDGEYRVIVKRGRAVRREEVARPPDAFCSGPEEREYDVAYEAEVRVRSRSDSWIVRGTLRRNECGP